MLACESAKCNVEPGVVCNCCAHAALWWSAVLSVVTWWTGGRVWCWWTDRAWDWLQLHVGRFQGRALPSSRSIFFSSSASTCALGWHVFASFTLSGGDKWRICLLLTAAHFLTTFGADPAGGTTFEVDHICAPSLLTSTHHLASVASVLRYRTKPRILDCSKLRSFNPEFLL